MIDPQLCNCNQCTQYHHLICNHTEIMSVTGDLGDFSFSFKNEHFVSKEGKELTADLPHTKTTDCDGGGSGDDGKDISRAKTGIVSSTILDLSISMAK